MYFFDHLIAGRSFGSRLTVHKIKASKGKARRNEPIAKPIGRTSMPVKKVLIASRISLSSTNGLPPRWRKRRIAFFMGSRYKGIMKMTKEMKGIENLI